MLMGRKASQPLKVRHTQSILLYLQNDNRTLFLIASSSVLSNPIEFGIQSNLEATKNQWLLKQVKHQFVFLGSSAFSEIIYLKNEAFNFYAHFW